VTINSEIGTEMAHQSQTQAAFLKVLAVVALAIGVVLALGLGIVISQAESMNEIVGELTALVGGNRSAGHRAQAQRAPVGRMKATSHHDMAPARGRGYGKSDEAFHHIASKSKTSTGSKHTIPLDDEDLDHFNN